MTQIFLPVVYRCRYLAKLYSVGYTKMFTQHWWNYTGRVKPKYLKKNLLPYFLSMNPIWSEFGMNLFVHRG